MIAMIIIVIVIMIVILSSSSSSSSSNDSKTVIGSGLHPPVHSMGLRGMAWYGMEW